MSSARSSSSPDRPRRPVWTAERAFGTRAAGLGTLPVATTPSRPSKLRTARMEAFSDDVYAISITLLILDVTIPPESGEHLFRAYLHQRPSYLAYVASLATIGASWLGHSLVTEYLDRADPALVRLNLLLLIVISIIPFPTRVVGEYVTERHAERVAITIYGIHLLVASLLLSAIWQYASRQKLVHPDPVRRRIEAAGPAIRARANRLCGLDRRGGLAPDPGPARLSRPRDPRRRADRRVASRPGRCGLTTGVYRAAAHVKRAGNRRGRASRP